MYEKCNNCAHSGKNCLPHIMALSASDLIAWCKDRKKRLDLSNAEIAEKSHVPKGTIDRLFGKEEFTEFRFTTIQPVIRVLIGCDSAELLDCAELARADNKLVDTISQQKERIETLEREKAYLLHQVETYSADYREQTAQYAENINALKYLCRVRLRAIRTLSSLLAVCVLVIIAALVVDRLNPNAGFFWRSMLDLFNIKRGITL